MGRKPGLVVVGFVAGVPALALAAVWADLDPAGRAALRTALGGQVVVLGVAALLLVAGTAALVRRIVRPYVQALHHLAADARTVAGPNPAHTVRLEGPAEVRAAAAAVRTLALRHAGVLRDLEGRVRDEQEALSGERDTLAALVQDLEVPVVGCTPDGLVLLCNDAARAVLTRPGGARVGVGRSLFGVLERDLVLDAVETALAGGSADVDLPHAGGLLRLRMSPLAGPVDGFLVVAAPRPLAAFPPPHPPAEHVPRAPSRPRFYDFALTTVPPGPQSSLRLAELALTVIDTETTGLRPDVDDRVVSLGAVRVVAGRVRDDDVLDLLVDPLRAVPLASTAVHGITTAMVRGRPPVADAVRDLVAFAHGTALVGHDVAFDLAFLRPAARSAGVELPEHVLDTLLLSDVLHPGAGEDHSLEGLARRYSVDIVGRHTALGDALVTAELLVRMIGPLADLGVETLGDAVQACSVTPMAARTAGRYDT